MVVVGGQDIRMEAMKRRRAVDEEVEKDLGLVDVGFVDSCIALLPT